MKHGTTPAISCLGVMRPEGRIPGAFHFVRYEEATPQAQEKAIAEAKAMEQE